ncbi:SDR family oxidoreductase [Variovorax sp. YR216]|uniref:SDR family oxidoreductase n=1 Tax=Variovorax sp. YR216 TaxID=1882828 RepID=UPI000897F2C5|nr:SDR family oxidoreductase [Variovorax sp. YR216]SEB23680.1 3-oxoacyl-[acyl-carrier protein] reductase [Variovorax sp. YR216]
MKLGLEGRHALVCASSRGLGRACAVSLAGEGVSLTLVARGRDALEETAAHIRRTSGVQVHAVVADITTAVGREAALAAHPAPDILVTNAGGPKPGHFRDWNRETWMAALDANMLAPIEMIRATIDGMARRRFGRIVNITSAAVKAPIDILGLSNGARSGLTGFVAGLARQYVAHNVTINNLLPGPFETDRLLETAHQWAKDQGRDPDEVLARRRAANPAGRFGLPHEFGDACAFLCSAQAGFITAQNLLLDGGSYPGTF